MGGEGLTRNLGRFRGLLHLSILLQCAPEEGNFRQRGLCGEERVAGGWVATGTSELEVNRPKQFACHEATFGAYSGGTIRSFNPPVPKGKGPGHLVLVDELTPRDPGHSPLVLSLL
jgi:hypothetical protein